MRRLMWFTIGFGASAAVCTYGWITEGLVFPAYVFAALFVLLLAGRELWKPLRVPAVVCLGIACGLLWFQIYSSAYLARTFPLDGHVADVTARCTDYGEPTASGTVVDCVLYLDGVSYRTRLYLEGDVAAEPGDVLTGAFRFRTAAPTGEFDTNTWQGKGIFLIGYQEEDCELKKLAQTPNWTLPAMLRQSLLGLIDELFPEDTVAFAEALLLGDRRGLDYPTTTAFQVSGIMHIIAVSGLHVTILFTLIYNVCLRKRALVALIGVPVLVLFAAVGGLSPSIVRACIMQGLIILAMLFQRDYDGPTELAFACLVMLVVNPLVITSVSFQLSVGCMAGIFLFQKPLSGWLSEKLGKPKRKLLIRLCVWFSRSVSMTVSAMSLTIPLVAWYFGCVSLAGVVTNLLTLWVISFVFYGIMLSCAAGWFAPALGAWIAGVISWPIRYVLIAAKILARFPLAAVYTRSHWIVAWLVIAYLLLGLFLIIRKRPQRFLGAAGAALCIALALSWGLPMLDDARMTVLNVGQGQSILLQSDGKTYLVDCGGSSDTRAADIAAHTLLSQGITRLDGLILTHFDRDHAGGAAFLLSRIGADAIFVPESEDSSGVLPLLEALAGGRVTRVSRDLKLAFGTTEISVFAPVIPDSGNESSLAVLFRRGNCDILITGDRSAFGERMLMKTAQLPDLEILVAGHHGSGRSTCEELLAATKPEILVISVGANTYGHPAQELLDRAENYGCTVYRTDIHGNLIFRR